MMTYEYIFVRYGEMTTLKEITASKFVSTLKDNVKFKLKKFPNIKNRCANTLTVMYIQINGE